MEIVEEANLTIQEMFSSSKQKRFKSGLDTQNWIIPGMPGGRPPQKKENDKSEAEEIKYIPPERNEQLMWLTSDSEDDDDENEIRKDLDEEEIKEIKEMEQIEGMLDDDGLQNELEIVDSLQPQKLNLIKCSQTAPSQKQRKEITTQSEITKPQYRIPMEEGNDSDEWMVDHTGIRRKPFKVMHREIREI